MESKLNSIPEFPDHLSYSYVMDALDKRLSPEIMYRLGENDKVKDERVFILTGTDQITLMTRKGPFKIPNPTEDEFRTLKETQNKYTIFSYIRQPTLQTLGPIQLDGKFTDDHDNAKVKLSVKLPGKQQALSFEFSKGNHELIPIPLEGFKDALFQSLMKK
jgi:hypothetical protein